MGSKLKGDGVEFPDGTLQTTAAVVEPLKLNGAYKKEPMGAEYQPQWSTAGFEVQSPNRGLDIENLAVSSNDNSIINGKHYYQSDPGYEEWMDLVFHIGWPSKPIKAIKITAEFVGDVSDYMFFLKGFSLQNE